MRTTLLLGAFAAVTLATAAQAQETGDPAPFTGVYVAAAGGYDVQPNDTGSTILFDRGSNGSFGDTVIANGSNAFSQGFCNGRARGRTPLPGGCANDKDGWSYYGRIGMDSQVGNIVVGALGEFGKTEISDSVSGFSTTPANYVMTRDVKWEASIRGRVGYAPGTTLFYGTFGPGYANIDRSFTTTNAQNAFAQFGKRKQFGIVGGGGIEQKIGEHVSVGMEYTFHQYNDDDARVRVSQGSAPLGNPFVVGGTTTDFRRSDEKFRWHSLRATAAFRF
ncbi:outer membrane protein [Sphingomonas melonis]|jgi:outer membrane immunogenic protein|uniref:Outer membrane immunogenic protein n=1 Tax=Sphingomonas melonis TaxID=152682 RepID=A0A7Y9FMD5_9SPHN|nr:outer membrane beta-barrel protein [Sphingomonas melonis]NYD89572.1 outer membrane immunogenic protein [Sphingomonas melonis]